MMPTYLVSELFMGVSLGFVAGVAPSPSLAFTVSQVLKHGWLAGVIITFSPLLSDLPIIILMTCLISNLPAKTLLIISFLGGCFITYIGLMTLLDSKNNSSSVELLDGDSSISSTKHKTVLLQSLVLNLLNPNPYIFWGTVGSQSLLKSYQLGGYLLVLVFLTGFYGMMLGAKLTVTYLVYKSREILHGQRYRITLAVCGALLIVLGVLFLGKTFRAYFYS